MTDYNLPDSSKIEPRFKEAIDCYVADHCPTGSFLEAVLENNLKEAFGRADTEAMDNLRHIVCYCYNNIPGGCWGSQKIVAAWLRKKP